MKFNLKISACRFSLTELKDRFILKTPTSNNVEFKNVDDVMRYLKKFYPSFVVKRFAKALGEQ